MKTVVYLLGVVFCIFGAASSLAQKTPEFDGSAAHDGQRSFRTYCASCHGKQGLGDGPLAEHLNVAPANLTKLAANNGGEFPYDAVFETINLGRKVRGHGNADMPAWGDAFLATDTKEEAQERMHTLVQYLWSLNK